MILFGSFFFFTALVAVLSWYFTKNAERSTNDGYFLAGRSLTFPFIAGSLLLTNLSTEQMVGLNGSAFKDGLSVMAWEVEAVVALVLMAIIFLPKFLRSGVTTVPEFLEIRFDHKVSVITNIIFLAAYAVILLPIILYTGANGLTDILDISAITGMEDRWHNIWLMVWIVGIIGSIYALFGGLKTIAVSDTLNGIGLLTGGLLIIYFALDTVGNGNGIISGYETITTALPEKFNSIGRADQEVPFGTLFSGVLIINLFYWCTNQQIIQRTFGARDLAEGQKGVLLTGLLKLIGPLYLVLPGIIAYYLFADQNIQPVEAYGKLVRHVLPKPLTGFFAAVMVGAILSSFNSALNSTCTLFSMGIYRTLINKHATEIKTVNSGKWFGLVLAIFSMTLAPFLYGQKSIFDYLQTMNAIYFIPIFSVVLVGMFSKYVPPIAAKVALIAGILIIAIGYFVPLPFIEGSPTFTKILNPFHFVGGVFLLLCVMMYGWGMVRPTAEAFVQKDVKAVDMTPWKYTKAAGLILIVIVVTIYVTFAK